MGSLLIAILLLITVSNLTLNITDFFLKGSFQYTWLFLNHALQLILVLGIMLLPIWSKKLSDWGVNVKNSAITFSLIKQFTIGWVVCTTLYIVISSWLSGWPYLLGFDLTVEKAVIYLLFEATIVGVAEELFFRGLVYGILINYFGEKITIKSFSISQAGIITAVLFAFAHTGIHIYPFTNFHIEPMQFLMALLLGIFYTVIFEKTGSLLGPILAHNIADVWLSILYIAVSLIANGI
jgi:membrane protease YdiL (CAAX protease family)